MVNLNDLKKMAKEGKISEKLLKDEDFKEKFKKTLKEENKIEITDEQFTEIIQDIENSLKDEKLLEEIELMSVSGGKKDSDSSLKQKIAKGAFYAAPFVGMIAGTVIGGVVGHSIGVKTSAQNSEHGNSLRVDDYMMAGVGSGLLTGMSVGGAVALLIDKTCDLQFDDFPD